MNIEEKLLQNNQEFIKKLENCKEKQQIAKDLVNGQHPYALIITCSDSRVVPEEIFSTFLGEIFVIRTAGNVVNEGELGTIEYAIHHLHIKYIMVLGHTGCGAIHAAMSNEHCKYADVILNRIRHAIGDTIDEEEASKINALNSVNYIKKAFPDYNGEVIAGVYNIKNNNVIIHR